MQIKKEDVFIGIAGGIIFGLAVLLINGGHGLAWIAAAKQFAVSFFVSIFVVRFAEWTAAKLHEMGFTRVCAAFVGSQPAIVIAIGGAYLVHQLRGTPEPLLSVLPQLMISPPSLWLFAWRAVAGKI